MTFIRKHIIANPKHTADTKAMAAQYFTILNRIEYVIELETKYSESVFLYFWQKFNIIYNQINKKADLRDPIEVYFDNQIGIVEVLPQKTRSKKKKPTKIAKGKEKTNYQFNILEIIKARNEKEAQIGELIKEFELKIKDLFDYIKNADEGRRLIVKINLQVNETEIYSDFAKIYRRYRALNRQRIGDYFFKEMNDLLEKLCDDFEKSVEEV